MLTERTIIGRIEINSKAFNALEIQLLNQIVRDTGEVVSETPHRYVKHPGDDISQEPAEVRAVASAVWTPEIIAAWESFKASQTI